MLRQSRRLPDEPVHEFQHRLIAERKASYDELPKRGDLARYRRRETEKRAWWTLIGHLRGMHDIRGQAPFLRMTWDDATELHVSKHTPPEG